MPPLAGLRVRVPGAKITSWNLRLGAQSGWGFLQKGTCKVQLFTFKS